MKLKSIRQRYIYRGLDTEPNYIAPPKNVKISYNKEN